MRNLPSDKATSRDEQHFERSFLPCGAGNLPPLRDTGRDQRPGCHYPHGLVACGCLHVRHATNKEDIELPRVPLSALDERRR